MTPSRRSSCNNERSLLKIALSRSERRMELYPASQEEVYGNEKCQRALGRADPSIVKDLSRRTWGIIRVNAW